MRPQPSARRRSRKLASPEPRRLGSNENPFPPLHGVLAAVIQAAERVNRYPDPRHTVLLEALSDHLDLPSSHVVVGPGSVDLLHRLIRLVSGPGDEVVTAWRSYDGHLAAIAAAGANPVQVPLTEEGGPDLPAMAAVCTERTKAILVCSPHNPTGTVAHAAELETFLDAVGPGTLIVVDEAYRDFVCGAAPDGLAMFANRSALCLVRTFSKGYGLAGLRVGYVVARPPLAQRLRDACIPYSVSQMAQDAAVESLRQESAMRIRVQAVVDERERMWSALTGQGWAVPPSQANFLWIPLGGLTDRFSEYCRAAGVGVKVFPGEGARVTVADRSSNELVLGVAERLVRHAPNRSVMK